MMAHIDMENHMTGKNCSEKVIDLAHLNKVMDVVAVDQHRMVSHHEDYSANAVAEVEKPVYP